MHRPNQTLAETTDLYRPRLVTVFLYLVKGRWQLPPPRLVFAADRISDFCVNTDIFRTGSASEYSHGTIDNTVGNPLIVGEGERSTNTTRRIAVVHTIFCRVDVKNKTTWGRQVSWETRNILLDIVHDDNNNGRRTIRPNNEIENN